jgi:hypothetical protein
MERGRGSGRRRGRGGEVVLNEYTPVSGKQGFSFNLGKKEVYKKDDIFIVFNAGYYSNDDIEYIKSEYFTVKPLKLNGKIIYNEHKHYIFRYAENTPLYNWFDLYKQIPKVELTGGKKFISAKNTKRSKKTKKRKYTIKKKKITKKRKATKRRKTTKK